MRYKKFRIKNFKGIRDTTINFDRSGKMGVYALVGLNESGKTTILEAIHSFFPDTATSELVGGDEQQGVPIKDRVPRDKISNFTGSVSVTATIEFNEEDKEVFVEKVKDKLKLAIDLEKFDNIIELEKQNDFKLGDYYKSFFSLRTKLMVKSRKQKKFRELTNDEHIEIRDIIYQMSPAISYFPTFVFNFPDRINLTSNQENRGGREWKINRFYTQVFQDILDSEGSGFTIKDSIIRRIRNKEYVIPWENFYSFWSKNSDENKINQVMDRASFIVTDKIFGSWNKIFGEDASGKEIIIGHGISEGEKIDESGALVKTQEHDIYVNFEIKDRTRRFKVNDRSLGFRWFFAFMLFTQFRVAREDSRPVLFLFDEPASNLHAAAQQRLIESFPEITRENATLVYSTHSHYMIEPKWLEQTFIVVNRADTPSDSIIGTISFDDESLDIQSYPYRDFVNKFPDSPNYFQPILDRLEIAPSRFDIQRQSIIMEGKSDYYIVWYFEKLLSEKELPIIPGLGAGTFSSLLSLHIGWGIQSIFVLDSDQQGKLEKDRYEVEFPVEQGVIFLLSEIFGEINEIEDLFDEESREIISVSLGKKDKKLTKKDILRFCQERLASNQIEQLSHFSAERGRTLISSLRKLMKQN